MPSRSFTDVELWKKAHAWVLSIYRYTELFPKHEIFALVQQLRRAAVSVPANFAEGFKKRGRLDKVRFMNIAQGSTEESRCYLLLSNDLGYGDTKPLLSNLEEVSRLLESYSRAILNSGS